MGYSNTIINKLKGLVDKCHSHIIVFYFISPDSYSNDYYSDDDIEWIQTHVEKSDFDKQAGQLYGDSNYEALKYEIYSNLSGFEREKQETYYYVILLDFLETLGKLKNDIKLCLAKFLKTKQILNLPDPQFIEYEEIHSVVNWIITLELLIESVDGLGCLIAPIVSPYVEKNNEYFIRARYEIQTFSPEQIPLLLNESLQTNQQIQPTKPNTKLLWNGDKTDLAELVWALAKSNQIIDTSTYKPVIIGELTRQFEILLGLEKLDVDGLVSKRIHKTYKSVDGKTFMDTLQGLMQERIISTLKK